MAMAAVLPVRAAFGQSSEVRRLRTQVLEILRQKYPQLQAKAGNEDSLIDIEAGAKIGTIDLTNLQLTVRQLSTSEQQAAIADYVGRLVERFDKLDDASRSSWAEMSKRLRPRLVPPGMRQAAPTMVLRDFAGGVLNAYVLDHGRQVEYVQRDMLDRWGVGSQRVHDTAVANLEALSEDVEIEVRAARAGGRFTVINTDDSYDAARLVLPQVRSGLLEALGTPILVGIPYRDFLLAWSADAPFAVFADHVAKDFANQPHPITDTVFQVDGGGVRISKAATRRKD
jgi:uncharacterized protein YtpQ (UPF0354 family)